MKWITAEQIRPQDCPLGRDECKGCKHFDDIIYHWENDIDIVCNYEKEEKV